MSENFTRWDLDMHEFVSKIQNTRTQNKVTYLEVSDRSKNLLSVQNMFEILWDNNRFPSQLLLSSEIGRLDGQPSRNMGNPSV